MKQQTESMRLSGLKMVADLVVIGIDDRLALLASTSVVVEQDLKKRNVFNVISNQFSGVELNLIGPVVCVVW